ncbi:hypothetical protein BOX15_Mlig011145g2 [Macrostomum lignano]|uniref:Uncharacterized protein n=2 Tax=Macrostomum lignano TaxID=282301 RepID=A0A267GHZ0_9PLAT|nr:hypothetical protein BOX15_Mlig011145g1 [Macrostomum lignano]PAA85671.1 hypothetical protein BOX15_Mlig011145g2 [Macrostomum lignano]
MPGPDDEPIHNGTLTVIRKIVPIYTWGFLLLVCFLFIMLLFAFLYMEQLLCFGYCKGRTCCDTKSSDKLDLDDSDSEDEETPVGYGKTARATTG